MRHPKSQAMQLAPLLDFIPAASPRFQRPYHLAPVAALLERTERESVRAVVSVTVRHGKTETIKHAMARRLLADPTLRLIYASYAQRVAEKRSREIRQLYRRLGGPLDEEAKARSDWRAVDDGGMWPTSVGGSVTGEGGDLIVVDDPHKGRAEAESAIERERVREWFLGDLYTRAEPHASIIVVQSRWHTDDLAGFLISQGWESVVLPAIDDAGRALWPERFSVERLREIEATVGPLNWSSLYQQRPIPRGGALFRNTCFYDALPTRDFSIGKGIDLAYSGKARSDASAAVVMLEHDDRYYVVDVRTARVRVPEFVGVLASIDGTYPGPWHWHTSTTEQGLADLATAHAGVHVVPHRATADKYVRAQSFAAAWNAGKVLLPRSAPWLDSFVSEICGFVGVGDRRDDQVDAAVSAFDSVFVRGYPRGDDDEPDHVLVRSSFDEWGSGVGWGGSRFGGSRGYG